MKVTTIDGGFRGRKGVGNLSTEQVLSEVESFEARLGTFREAATQAKRQIAAGVLPQATARALDATITALEDRANAHVEASSNLQSASELLAWRAEAGRIVALAQAFVAQARGFVRVETSTRPWKIALALVVGTAVIFGAARVLGQVRS